MRSGCGRNPGSARHDHPGRPYGSARWPTSPGVGPGSHARHWHGARRRHADERRRRSECKRNGETRRVDEWNEARPGLGDLESPDRASAQAGAPATSAPLRPGLLALGLSAGRMLGSRRVAQARAPASLEGKCRSRARWTQRIKRRGVLRISSAGFAVKLTAFGGLAMVGPDHPAGTDHREPAAGDARAVVSNNRVISPSPRHVFAIPNSASSEGW